MRAELHFKELEFNLAEHEKLSAETRFCLYSEAFSVGSTNSTQKSAILSQSMKIKRNVADNKFKEEINQIFDRIASI